MDILQKIAQCLTLIVLGIAAITDAKCKKISVVLVIVGFVSGVFLQIIIGSLGIFEIVGGCILGVLFVLIARLTRGAVGYGDGLILVVTGVSLGIMDNLLLLLFSLALAGIFSVIMLVAKKKKRNSELPFVPFMLGGYVLLITFF